MASYEIDSNLILDRVVIKVIDLERQTAFYEQIVGLHIVEKTTDYTTFSAGEGESVIFELRKEAQKLQPALSTGLFLSLIHI